MLVLGYLFVSLSEIWELHYLSKIYLGKKEQKRTNFFLIHILYVLITVLQVYFVYDPNLNTAINFLMRIAISQCYKGAIYIRILICATSLLAGFLGEGIVLTLFRIFLDIDLSNALLNEIYMLFICIAGSIAGIAMIYVISNLLQLYQKHKKKWYAGIFFMLLALIFLSIDLLVNFGKSEYLTQAIFIIFLLVIAIAAILDMFRDQLKSQKDSLRTEFLEKQLAMQLLHYESLYEQISKIHEIRHDVKNILINIESYLKLGETGKAYEYIHRYQSELSSSEVIDSGVPVIDAILTAKKCNFKGDFRLHMIPIKCEYIDLTDIGMMLAIALDNAIEGTDKIHGAYIIISIIQQSRMISIQIKNPTLNHPSSIQKFPSSTKSDTANHGYGLKSCNRLAEKWNGGISWNCSDGIFTLDIFIQDIPSLKE